MLRLPSRATARLAQSSLAPARTMTGRRFLTTQPPHLRSRSWKNSAARWGIAIAGIYYYTTSPIFAEEPQNNLLNPNLDILEEETSGTSLEDLTSRPRRQQSKQASALVSAVDAASSENASTTVTSSTTPNPQDLEEEADQQGAFNPETGEINWDCPCLGGMAHGPCGPQFREAFSCFVYSTQEPKGMDCIEKFQGMQECFKEHPDVYKSELDEEGDEGEYDEAMAAEKEELVKEIKERREKMGIGADGSSKTPLEQSTDAVSQTAPNVTKPNQPALSSAPDSRAPHAQTSRKPASEAKVSTKGHPAEHEHVNEGQKSSPIRKPNATSVGGASDNDDGQELIPRAAHDASDAKVPDDKQPMSKP